METMAKIVHNNYEKITDDVFWLSSKYVLKFNVCLNRYSDKYGKVNYHKEVMYNKNKSTCININRSFDYFLSLESTFKKDNGMKDYIIISNIDFYLFKRKINLATEWFTSSTFKDIYAKKDGKIFMPRKIDSIVIRLGQNALELEPSIFELDNGDQIIGINMYINNSKIFIDVNKYLSFSYFIDVFNMYQSAQLMLNYLQRPEYGSNMYQFDNPINYNNEDNSSVSFPKNNNNDTLGFFNRIKNKSKE